MKVIIAIISIALSELKMRINSVCCKYKCRTIKEREIFQNKKIL